jgi:hypothetical protein
MLSPQRGILIVRASAIFLGVLYVCSSVAAQNLSQVKVYVHSFIPASRLSPRTPRRCGRKTALQTDGFESSFLLNLLLTGDVAQFWKVQMHDWISQGLKPEISAASRLIT